jgi:hypothetical protein
MDLVQDVENLSDVDSLDLTNRPKVVTKRKRTVRSIPLLSQEV